MSIRTALKLLFTLSFSACVLSSCVTAESSDVSSGTYIRPELRLSDYDKTAFVVEGESGIYIEKTANGYVCANSKSDKRLKFQVEMSGQKYNYDLNNKGETEVFPLQMGNGTYTFTIYENIVDDKYAQLLKVTKDVMLDSEFEAFLRPNQIINYNQYSSVVSLSNEITKDAKNESEVVEKIYNYITSTIKYDEELAKTVKDGYLSDVDNIINIKKGICFDYSALCAAMLRAQGIPTKLVTGYVSPKDVYHAWNMIYLKDKGWKYKKVSIDMRSWGRIDTTFAAGDKGLNLLSFIGDGKSYADKYTY